MIYPVKARRRTRPTEPEETMSDVLDRSARFADGMYALTVRSEPPESVTAELKRCRRWVAEASTKESRDRSVAFAAWWQSIADAQARKAGV